MKFSPLGAVFFLISTHPAFAVKRPGAVPIRAKKKASPPVVMASTAPAPSVAPEPPSAAVVAPRDEADLALFGLALAEEGDGLTISDVISGTPADSMGPRRGDRIWNIDRTEAVTRAQAASARQNEPRVRRESLVVRRNLEVLALSGSPYLPPADPARGPVDLTPHERSAASVRGGQDLARAREIVAETPSLEWTLRADQSFWVRFPAGIPTGLKRDDILEGEVSTGLTTDAMLDYLAFPPSSRVWARVVSATDDGEIRSLRLIFFKIRPTQGRIYPILGVATALAASTSQLSSGGTMVRPVPLPGIDGRKRGDKDLFVDGDSRLRVKLLKPVTLAEPPSWWRAGPGLWFKTVTDGGGHRRFSVTYVVAGRSAAASGVKVGDLLDAVGGRSADRVAFEEALNELYGPRGSTVKISLMTSAGSRAIELTRGVKEEGQKSVPVPLPFETR